MPAGPPFLAAPEPARRKRKPAGPAEMFARKVLEDLQSAVALFEMIAQWLECKNDPGSQALSILSSRMAARETTGTHRVYGVARADRIYQ